MITKLLKTILRLATAHPLYLLAAGLAVTSLAAGLFFGLRFYFSAESRQIRKLTRPGIVYRFLRFELLVALATAAAAIVYQFFDFRGRGHYIYWRVFRRRIGPPHSFFSFVRWDAERLLFRVFPAVERWWKLMGFHVAAGVLAQHGYELQADYFAGYMFVGLQVIAAATFVGWQLIEWRFALAAPALANHPPEVMIGGIAYPRKMWTSHLLISATTRWGKSVTLSNMVSVFSRCQIPGLFLDNASNFLSKFFNPEADLILSLTDARAAPYSFFCELSRPENIRRLFHNLVPDGASEAGRYFQGQARKLLIEICEALWTAGSLTNGEFCAAFRDQEKLLELLAGTEWPDTIENAKSWGDVKATASTYLDIFSRLPAAAGLKKIALSGDGGRWEIEREGVSISRAVGQMAAGRGCKIFVPYEDANAAAIGPWLSMIAAVFCDAVMGLGEDLNRRVVAVIDEGGAGSEIAKLRDILSRGGKYGLSVIFCAQTTAQIEELYGQTGARILLANFNSILIGRLPDAESSAWAADLVGKHYKMVSSSSESHGDHDSTGETRREELRHKILPAEIQHLPDLEGILIYSSIGLQKRVRISREAFQEIHPRHVDLPASAWRPAGVKPVQKSEATTAAPPAPEPRIIFQPLAQDSSGEDRAKTEAGENRK